MEVGARGKRKDQMYSERTLDKEIAAQADWLQYK
jgi:hypothetical protein